MRGLGRVYNTIVVADGVWVPLRDADAVDFLCYLAIGDTFTVQQARDAAGTGAVDLPVLTRYYGGNGVGGAWLERLQAAAAAVTIATDDAAILTVLVEQLSDGFTHVRCTSTGAGTVTAVQYDLKVERAPQNLAALV